MSIESPDYITTAEICKRLALSRAAVTRLLHAGRIRHLDVSTGQKRKRFRILRSDFEKFLEEISSDKKDS